jgi:hypothetical protein
VEHDTNFVTMEQGQDAAPARYRTPSSLPLSTSRSHAQQIINDVGKVLLPDCVRKNAMSLVAMV